MKKNIFFSMALALALLLTLGASNILAQSYTVTVKLLDSNNNGLPDGEVKYYNGGWQLLGTTDGTGTVSGLVPKHPNTNNRDFLMQYKAGRDYSQKAVDITTNPTLTYQTVPLTIKLETCDGTPLDGTAMQYIGGWQDLGPTPITVERLPNPSTNYAIGMNFDNRKDLTTFNAVNPATTPEVIFKTTKITFSNNTVFWYNGGWKTFTSPKEVLAGIGWAHFKIGDVHNPTVELDISGCAMDLSVITMTLKNSSGAGVPGGKAYLGVGGWPYVGETDEDGNLTYVHASALGNMRIKMTAPNYGGSQTSPYQDIPTNSHFNFQTSQVVLQLKHSDGSLQNGGEVLAGAGGWPKIGETGANGQGTLYHEYFLPATFNYRMKYNLGTQEKSKALSVGDNTIIWQTGLVKLWFSGTIQHGVGGWPAFSNPYEMLPVEHRFGFSGSGHPRTELKFTPPEGGLLEKTIAYIHVKKSDGSGMPGITATWQTYGGPGPNPVDGSTNSSGVLLNAIDGYEYHSMGTTHTIEYLGGKNSKRQKIPTDSFFDFQLCKVIVVFQDHSGALMSATPKVHFQHYGAAENEFGYIGDNGIGKVEKDLLPSGGSSVGSSYTFKIKEFNSSSGAVSHVIINTNPQTVVFQTGRAVDAGFNPTTYNQYGHATQSFPVGGIELMPSTSSLSTKYYFKKTGSTIGPVIIEAGKILSLNSDGSTTLSKAIADQYILDEEIPLPTVFGLSQNYPNPFNPTTTIQYQLPEEVEVTLIIYNMLGTQVRTLVNENKAAGYYEVVWDACNDFGIKVSSGMYICRIVAGEFNNVKRLTLLK